MLDGRVEDIAQEERKALSARMRVSKCGDAEAKRRSPSIAHHQRKGHRFFTGRRVSFGLRCRPQSGHCPMINLPMKEGQAASGFEKKGSMNQ